MIDAILVVTTTANVDDARKIARSLLEQKLATCVQINGPQESHYWWQGEIESASEWQCVIKTRSTMYDAIEQAVRAVHPYETPEILAIPLVAGSQKYLQWLQASTEDSQ